MTDPVEQNRVLRQALRGALCYIKVSNPKSLTPRDVQARILAMDVVETALALPEPQSNTAQSQPLTHPLHPKMGELVQKA